MAQADWDQVHRLGGHSQAEPEGGASLVSLAGGLISLALIVGLAVWGYKLAVRDVSGVPVVRALEGPMRIQPDDPGGQAAAHQGLAVNNIQADGQAELPAERLALAPRPVDLEDEDQPVEPAPQISAAAYPLPTDRTAAARALAEAITAGVKPLGEEEQPVQVSAATPDVPAPVPRPADAIPASARAPAVIPASVPGVSVSPRPVPRPAELPASTVAAESPAGGVREIAPGDIPVGTRLVQLGAFDSVEVARAEWDRLAVRFEEYMDGKDRVIELANAGGKDFYRLRAMGFDDLDDARRFCSVLMAAKAACIPVVTR
jgi:hypothetical protein